jgi:N-acetylmuramoyl-L-alanine amidase/Mannosyl-glycoprotein endo-beta-N-acetylglucosaminidase
MAIVVLVQAGHELPLEPGIDGRGAAGEVDLNIAIRDALVARLRTDARFEAIPSSGNLPDGIAVDAALFLHCDGAVPAARGFSFGYPTASAAHRALAEAIAGEFERLPGHPQRRVDNTTVDAASYYGFRRVQAPAMCLVEHGFVTNPDEHAWLQGNVTALADAEYRALCRHFGLDSADYVTTATGLNLRAGASTDAPVLTVLGQTTTVRVIGPDEAGFRHVQVAGTGAVGVAAGIFLTPAPSGPITPDTFLIGGPRATGERIAARFRAVGHFAGNGYGPNAIDTIVSYYLEAAAGTHIDPLLALAQMALETDWLGSARAARPECNPAGIGVVESGQPGVVFGSWKTASRAHVGRLLAYALPVGAGTPQQQSLIAVALGFRPLPEALRGVAPRLRGLTGTWATAPDYAEAIARVAETMRA